MISVGDYNAYQFNDGYTDPIATLKGEPTPDDQLVVDGSPDLVNPNFVNLTDTLPAAERYSFIFEGTPQALDHVLVNTRRRSATHSGWRSPAATPTFRRSREPVRWRRDAAGALVRSRHAGGVLPRSRRRRRMCALTMTAHRDRLSLPAAQVSYAITVTNAGAAPAQHVVVTDTLPSVSTLVICRPTGGGMRRFRDECRRRRSHSLAPGASPQ